MSYIDDAEVRRPSRGTKVLAFGFSILAILRSFWGIVWFIRTYVEPPRVMLPSPLALAAAAPAPKRNYAEPPLPRPRPDGPAPQSVFTGVPVTDDRFPTQ